MSSAGKSTNTIPIRCPRCSCSNLWWVASKYLGAFR